MLVIFDCDGVLVDSEQLAAVVLAEQLREMDIVLTPDECQAEFQGLTLDACYHRLIEMGHGSVPMDFKLRIERATHRAFSERLTPVEGVREVVEHLRRSSTPYCVASNGSLEKMAHSLSVCGLAEFFRGRRYSAEQVPRGKPCPDVFLLAAEAMGVPPQFCTVVEDSAAGVTAALAAGMQVLRYCATPQSAQDHGSAGANVDVSAVKVTEFSAMTQLLPLLMRQPKHRRD